MDFYAKEYKWASFTYRPWFGNRLNPFELIAHQGSLEPDIETVAIKRVQNNRAVVFQPENIIFGLPVILESAVNTSDEKDLNEWSVKCTNEINEIVFYKAWRIADIDDSVHNITNARISLNNPVNNMEWIYRHVSEGIYPYDPIHAEENNAEPGYDYFKSKWPSKKSSIAGQAEAWVNKRAFYPDGEYTVTFAAKDITGNDSDETKDVILDNHKPYVQEVRISSGKNIYRSIIKYSDPEIGSNGKGELIRIDDEQAINDCADFENDLEIIIVTSEQMNDVTIDIPDAGISGYTMNLTNYFKEKEWKGVISKNELGGLFEYSNNYQMIIKGHDKAGNQIINLGLYENGSTLPVRWLPYRDNDGVWINDPGSNDKAHKIPFCSTDFIKAIFHAVVNDKKSSPINGDNLYGNSPLEVSFFDESTGNPEEWTWDFGDNSLPVSDKNTTHTFVNNTDEPIQYSVTLKACNESGCDLTIENKLITVYPEGYENIPIADFSYNQETFASPYQVRFYNYSAGEINSFEWSFGDGATNTSDFEPVHAYSLPGEYDVSLTLNPGTNKQVVYNMEIEVFEASSNFAPIDFKWKCIANINNMNSGEGIVGELINFETTEKMWDGYCFWDMGDGTKYDNLNYPAHAYLSTGIFPVKLSVWTFDGKLIGQKTKLVSIVPNTQIIQPAENEIQFDNGVEDVQLFDNDVMVVASGTKFITYYFDKEAENWNLISTVNVGTTVTSLSGNSEFLFVGCGYEDYDGASLKGKVHIYKQTGTGVFVEQQVINDPEYYWYWRFGQYVDVDDDVAVISAYNEQGKHYKVTIWRYNSNNQNWNLEDVKFTNAHPPSPKISVNNGMIAINSDIYTFYSNQWLKINTPIQYDDGYILNGNATIGISNFYLASAVHNIDNSYTKLYVFNDNGVEQLPDLFLSDAENNFSKSIALDENYLIAGNNGVYDNCDNIRNEIKGSAILFRANDADYFYKYRTYIPENILESESFGYKVYANKDFIIVASPGVNNDEFYKAPSLYYYYNYAYFGDREITLADFTGYNLRSEMPKRFSARKVVVGGSAYRASVKSGESIETIGQEIVLQPGFSVTSGGVFKATGTTCESYNAAAFQFIPEVNGTYTYKNQNIERGSWKKNNSFLILPNPTRNKVIVVSKKDIIDKVYLFDSYGNHIQTINNKKGISRIQISLDNLPVGLYFVSIISNNNVETKKIIKL